MANLNLLSRRSFFERSFKAGAGLGLASLLNVPPFARRALAQSGIGANGKKLLFIFLRGANDALNSVIPIGDSAYNNTNRPNIFIPPDPGTNYATPGLCDFPTGLGSTFQYANAIRLGNGFAALHPSLKFLAPLYNVGELALVHRVGYPKQSRSHFDSQAYWESGEPNTLVREGIFYRTLLESGLTQSNPLTGVSIQSGLPLLLRGSAAALTNLSDPTRYDLMGLPDVATTGDLKAKNALLAAQNAHFADKRSRPLLSLQYKNMLDTLDIFANIDFTEAGNIFVDDANSDGAGSSPYHLFPTDDTKNGGGTQATYAVDQGSYSFFEQLKAAALILNNTDAIIAGTELTGFDTHNNEGGVTGNHADLQTQIAWAMYGLKKYFTTYSNKATWSNTIVVTLTEFGRTTIQNGSGGTDHAEAGAMFVAGGGIKGYGRNGRTSGVFGCHTSDSIPWVPGSGGSMFGVSGRYLQRAIDYRSVLGEIIRDHLGATPDQLGRIIPGYATPGENLAGGGTSSIDGTPIMGEIDLV
jgi:uncharacterized protein (DUF1501 family)